MNIVEKILARASGKSSVTPDDVIFANVDKVMMHDVSGPGVLKVQTHHASLLYQH